MHPRLDGEIQGLRAVAVLLVVVFHMWPEAIPGGYVGVDVFFVISGYLITGSLLRSLESPDGLSLVGFFSRRIWRLLPTATLVLVAVAIATLLVLPPHRWLDTFKQIAASATYLENIYLARLSVDYLAAEYAASPVQHYWSLAVEEQFYVVWPAVILSVSWIAKKLRRTPRTMVGTALTVLLFMSLTASAYLTHNSPEEAYFLPHTRGWELALGGILSLLVPLVRLPVFASGAALIFGLGLIVFAALGFNSQTAFPGLAALVPTIGASLVILAGPIKIGRFAGLDFSIARYIGDRSYSLYLWHWPLVIFLSSRVGDVTILQGALLIFVSLALSDLSYRHVEQRFRRPRIKSRWLPFLFAGLSAVVTFAFATCMVLWIQSPVRDLDRSRYPGALALAYGMQEIPVAAAEPHLARLSEDLPAVYTRGCHQSLRGAEVLTCELGDPSSSKIIAIVGDSHAANWVPALEELAAQHKWRLLTHTRSSCAFGEPPVNEGCAQWQKNVVSTLLAERPATVIFARMNDSDGDEQAVRDNAMAGWQPLLEAGLEIYVMRDTPRMNFGPGECLALNPTRCHTPRAEAIRDDPFARAAADTGKIRVIDLNDAICGRKDCNAVVGNIVVWRDTHHLTATFSRTLAPLLDRQLVSIGSGE